VRDFFSGDIRERTGRIRFHSIIQIFLDKALLTRPLARNTFAEP
jgi:hypothetical protein